MKFDWSSGAVGLVFGVGITLCFAIFSQLYPGVCGADEPGWVCGREWLVAVATSLAAISASFALLEWSNRNRDREKAIRRATVVVGTVLYIKATTARTLISRYLQDDPDDPEWPVMTDGFVFVIVGGLRQVLEAVRDPLLLPALSEDTGEMHRLAKLIERECSRLLLGMGTSEEVLADYPAAPIPDRILQQARIPLGFAIELAGRLGVEEARH